jgi:hypothetical protein
MQFSPVSLSRQGARGSVAVKGLCYKPEGVAGSRPNEVNEFFQYTYYFRPH